MTAREREVRVCATGLPAQLGVTAAPVHPTWMARRQGVVAEEPLTEDRRCQSFPRWVRRLDLLIAPAA